MSMIKNLVKQAKQHYPKSKRMRKAWVKQTHELIQSGKHGLLSGGWTISTRARL